MQRETFIVELTPPVFSSLRSLTQATQFKVGRPILIVQRSYREVTNLDYLLSISDAQGNYKKHYLVPVVIRRVQGQRPQLYCERSKQPCKDRCKTM